MLLPLSNIFKKIFNPSILNFSKYSAQVKLSPIINKSKRQDAKKAANEIDKTKIPIIVCKRNELNFYEGQTYAKFQSVPLVSKGWSHKDAKGDFFTIHPIKTQLTENSQNENKNDVKFEHLGVRKELVLNLKNYFNIEKPTSIQQKGIPQIASYQNTKLTAETGCGKTFAYLLPLISQVLDWKSVINRKFNQPLALIITPSRELAIQIGKEAKRVTKGLNLRTKVVVGGSIRKKIINPPVSDVDIIVATFGALSKHATLGIYKMNFVRHVVLDEADSLFDETFYDKLRHFLQRLSFGPLNIMRNNFPVHSQLTLVSATMPQYLEEILEDIVDPCSLIQVSTEKLHRIFVKQRFLRLGVQQKPMTLLKLVKKKPGNKSPIIIFTNDSDTCNWVSLFLMEFNVPNVHLNGQMSINTRKGKFDEFQRGYYNVLVTTDAGSRGLDTVMVKEVINYDFPLQTSEYIHRCGRTARVGSPKDCKVINFIARPLEILLAQKIEKAARLMKPIPMVDYLKRNWDPANEEEKERENRDQSRNNLKNINFESEMEEHDQEKKIFDSSNEN